MKRKTMKRFRNKKNVCFVSGKWIIASYALTKSPRFIVCIWGTLFIYCYLQIEQKKFKINQMNYFIIGMLIWIKN